MSLLTAHLINGQPVGLVVKKYSLITVPFKIESSPSPGYTDISTIQNWWDFGFDINQDYLYVRREIKNLVNQKGVDDCISTISDPPGSPVDGDRHYIDPNATATGDWATYEGYIATWDETNTQWVKEPRDFVGYRLCTTEEKLICSKLKIGSSADHFTDYGVPTIVDYGEDYHRNAIETRTNRMLRAIVEVYNRLPINAYEVLSDLTSTALGDTIGRYKDYGVQGTLEDYDVDHNNNPTPGVCDYLLSRAPFNNVEPHISAGYPAGLTLKGWSPIDATTLNDFATELYNILVYGDASGT